MKVNAKSKFYPWSERTVDILKAELDQVIDRRLDVPVDPGGWWHQYVCPEHHTELMFDPLEADCSTFRCPYGCEVEGEPYRGAWLVFKHQSMARYVLQSAAVYAGTGEKAYADLGKKLIVRYAEQFPLYPVHPDAQPWMLKGRAFHQALTEAIWATTLLRGYLLLKDAQVSFDEAEHRKIDQFLHMLESSMTEYHHVLTWERGNPENNYTAWLIAALFSIYAVQGETEKLRQLVAKEGGLRHHLSIAIRPDQLEFEGSIYYHVFVLRAYLIAAEMGARVGEELFSLRGEQGQSMQGMLAVLVRLSDPNGFLPALHDGPYCRAPYAREIAEIAEIGLSVYGDKSYQRLLENVYRELNGEAGRVGMLEALLYGTGHWDGRSGVASFEAKGSHKETAGGVWEVGDIIEVRVTREVQEAGDAEHANQAGHELEGNEAWDIEGRNEDGFPDLSTPAVFLLHSGFALLKSQHSNGLQALVDFGPHGGSHGHFDKLNLMIHVGNQPLSPDRGTVPYGSILKKEWYPHTACHNTVSVGRRSQNATEGKCIRYESGSKFSYLWVRSDQAYEQGVLDRHLILTEDWLLDWFEVELAEPAAVDWWFHYVGKGELSGLPNADQGHVITNLGNEDGYAYVKENCTHVLSEDGLQFNLHIANASGPLAVTSFIAFEGMECSQVESPGIADDPSRLMEGLRLHRTDSQARFIAVYRTGTEPLTLEWNRSEDGDWLSLSDGRTVRSFTMTNNGLKERVLDENLV
ncbi:heparinase II/III family protein [Paenibacillus sp. EZ-K15]|uniref:heparinase II/III domain-containing protein n=1 Tax=Paenibacillus sp. EZ-K15 TaxID=2044275 RepID=UPI000BF2A02F|nr:heparinase II/III family protein [Paenibacillus sp. EZ-K15]